MSGGRRLNKAVHATETVSQHVLEVPANTVGGDHAQVVDVDVTAVVGVSDVLRREGANRKRNAVSLGLRQKKRENRRRSAGTKN